MMTHKTVHRLVPSYLSHLIKPHIPPRALRFHNSVLLKVPGVKKKSAGCGACHAPFLWNNLPADIRQPGSIEAFKSNLIMYFFD